MKFKKILTFCLSLFLVFCIVGCGEAKTSSAVGNNLNKSVNNLSSVLDKLEEVTYNDIIIDNINPLSDNTFNTVSRTNSTTSKWYAVGAISESDKARPNAKYVNADITKENKIGINQNSNENCENGSCYNTNTATYKPKYVNNVSNSFVRTSLDSYIKNIEVLYNDCADCISCEVECKNAKNTLCQNINECKTLCLKLKDGTIKLSTNEIQTCNEQISTLKNYTNRLNQTKGNIKTKVNGVAKIKATYSSQVNSVKQAYEKLLEALETRLECLNDCNNALYSIKDIINKTNVNIQAAEKNKSSINDIKNYNENLDNVTNRTQSGTNKTNIIDKNTLNDNQNITSQNNTNTEKQPIVDEPVQPLTNNNNSNNSNNNGNATNNQSVAPIQQPITQQPVVKQPNNGQNVPNTTYNYGQNGLNNGYPYGTNNPYPPRNIDTYQNINKNIDTYRPNTPIYNGNYVTNTPITNQNNLKVQKPATKQNINESVNQKQSNQSQTDIKTYNQSINDNNEVINNKNIINENTAKTTTHIKDVLDKQFIDYQKQTTDANAPLPYPYDNKKIAEQNKKEVDNIVKVDDEKIDDQYGIMTLEEPIKDTTMQKEENTENTNKTTAMQEKNIDNTVTKQNEVERKIKIKKIDNESTTDADKIIDNSIQPKDSKVLLGNKHKEIN